MLENQPCYNNNLPRNAREASEATDFEQAAQYRDKIKALTSIQAKQDINPESVVDDVDVIGAFYGGRTGLYPSFLFRGGRNYSSKA